MAGRKSWKKLWNRLKSYHHIMIEESEKEIEQHKENKENYLPEACEYFIHEAQRRIRQAKWFLAYMQELEDAA